jgi:hypothetical protein
MKEDSRTHKLETKKQRGSVSKVNADEGGRKHALPRDEETKVGVSTANADEGGREHTPTNDKEAKGV